MEMTEQQEIAELRQQLAEATEELRMYRALGQCLAQFSVSFSESQKSMAAMAAVMQSERDAAKKAASVSAGAREEILSIAGTLNELSGQSASTLSVVDSLHSQSTKITDIIEFIQQISMQTHLLSMNAAVEAARAGEHGRGFSVLAKEIQSLSAKTDRATKDIIPLVKAIQYEAGTVKKSVNSLSDQARQFSSRGGHMAQSMGDTLDLALHMEGTISASTLRTFVELAKLDHLIFKFEVYRVFFRLSDKTAQDLAHHTGCRLGKWYYEGEGRTLYSHLPGYREIETPHKEVHAAGKEALTMLAAGQVRAAVEALAHMEKSSLRVIAGLEKMAQSG